MSCSRPVFDDKVELLHLLQPPCLLSDRVRSMTQPRQRSVVGTNFEMAAKQVLLEELEEMNYSQKFFPCDAVVTFSSVQRSASIRHNTLDAILFLREDCANR